MHAASLPAREAGLQVGELTAPGSPTIEVPSDFLEPGTYPFTVFGRANRYAGMTRAASASLTVAAP